MQNPGVPQHLLPRWRSSWALRQVSSPCLLQRPCEPGSSDVQTHGPVLMGRLWTDLSMGSAPAHTSSWHLL